jgi:hypothetical protein
MNREIVQNVARAISMRCKFQDDSWCDLLDIKNGLSISIEFADSGDGLWIWSCQAVARDLMKDGPNPLRLLTLNDDGLLWCYHALHLFEDRGLKGLSVNLKYTFATPADNLEFAQRLLGKVLLNMQQGAINVTRKI